MGFHRRDVMPVPEVFGVAQIDVARPAQGCQTEAEPRDRHRRITEESRFHAGNVAIRGRREDQHAVSLAGRTA